MSAAVRTVLDEELIPLDYRKVAKLPPSQRRPSLSRRSTSSSSKSSSYKDKSQQQQEHYGFHAPLPERLLMHEPHRDRLAVFWNDHFSAAVTQLCRARQQKKFLVHTNAKRSIFQAGMERICNELSGMAENIKVHFIVTPIVKQVVHTSLHQVGTALRKVKLDSSERPPKLRYHIRVVLLSVIPKEIKADQVKQRYEAEITSEQDLTKLAKEEFDKKPLNMKPLTVMSQIEEGDEEEEDDSDYDDDDDEDGELPEIFKYRDDRESLILKLSERGGHEAPEELYHMIQHSFRPMAGPDDEGDGNGDDDAANAVMRPGRT